MAVETQVICSDEYGADAYRVLYEDIMFDIGKIASIERSCLVLKPEVPLFIISVKMRGKPAAKRISNVASTRAEKDIIYVSISDEMYAPGILSALWEIYGRDNVQQLERLEIAVRGPKTSAEVDDITVESAEEPVREILGALWRVLPEGIRVRRSMERDGVVSVVATEEVMLQDYLDVLTKVHDTMVAGGVVDV